MNTMAEKRPVIAIYPGSFDPITLGHLNIIKRAAPLFDKLIVCVMVNASKNSGLFERAERVELIERVLKGTDLTNVEVDSADILLAEYAKEKGAKTIVKGLRAISDYENEVQMAIINAKINPGLETVFLPSGEKYTYISSTVVKEVASYGAALHEFIPREIVDDLMKKIENRRKK